jgi:hypothetical protein
VWRRAKARYGDYADERGHDDGNEKAIHFADHPASPPGMISSLRKEVSMLFFRRKPPADRLTNHQLVERFKGEVRDALDTAMDGRKWDRALKCDIERALRDAAQLLAMQQAMS